MRYEGNIFRPPSEAFSLIVQVTIGCAHNKCTFCSMYKDKQFRIRNIDEVIEDLDMARHSYHSVKRIFLADGDAMVLKVEDLLRILNHIRKVFPECERVGIYSSPQDILRKTEDELKTLKEHGIGIAYMGIESGSDKILKAIQKGVTSEQIIAAGQKLKASGIESSVTLISGIGGQEMWKEHAVESGRVISAIDPTYVGLLTLMVERGTPLYDDIHAGKFKLISPVEVLVETAEMIKNINVTNCVFRSNHASNYLSLKGDLPQDKERLLKQIEMALENTSVLKDERFRAL